MYYPEDNSMTWRLDYNKQSDFDDIVGIWHVEENPNDREVCSSICNKQCSWVNLCPHFYTQGICRVFYCCDISLKIPAPAFIVDKITKSNLKQALSWIKREA